jgi:hypothetical protein
MVPHQSRHPFTWLRIGKDTFTYEDKCSLLSSSLSDILHSTIDMWKTRLTSPLSGPQVTEPQLREEVQLPTPESEGIHSNNKGYHII